MTPISQQVSEPVTPREVGDGLRLRWATPADVERLAELNARVFRPEETAPPSDGMRIITRDMMSGRHPLVRAEDFVLVEDVARDAVVAGMCLMRQRWDYEGVEFDVGRPELVATEEAYRNRGLIRALFAALHARSEARGEVVQAITGIAYFYRQFGYEYAVDLEGGRLVYTVTVPEKKDEGAEPYRLEPATADDLPFILDLYDRQRRGLLLSTVIPEAFLRFALAAPSIDHVSNWRLYTIRDVAGERRGYTHVSSKRWGPNLVVWELAATAGTSLQAVAPALLRAFKAWGPATPTYRDPVEFTTIWLNLGREHPFYDALGEGVAPRVMEPYAWYVRVPDLPGFLRLLAPALERRLAASPLSGHSGELRLNFYRDGLKLTFDAGRLTAAESWRRPHWGERPQAGFPPLVFLQLLFGYRSLAELREAFPDVTVEDDALPLLNVLFPKRLSRLLALD